MKSFIYIMFSIIALFSQEVRASRAGSLLSREAFESGASFKKTFQFKGFSTSHSSTLAFSAERKTTHLQSFLRKDELPTSSKRNAFVTTSYGS